MSRHRRSCTHADNLQYELFYQIGHSTETIIDMKKWGTMKPHLGNSLSVVKYPLISYRRTYIYIHVCCQTDVNIGSYVGLPSTWTDTDHFRWHWGSRCLFLNKSKLIPNLRCFIGLTTCSTRFHQMRRTVQIIWIFQWNHIGGNNDTVRYNNIRNLNQSCYAAYRSYL